MKWLVMAFLAGVTVGSVVWGGLLYGLAKEVRELRELWIGTPKKNGK